MNKDTKNIIINELSNFLNSKDDVIIDMREKLYKYSYNKPSLNFKEDINDNIKIIVEDVLVLYERFNMNIAFCRIKRKNYKSMHFIMLFNNKTHRIDFIAGENIKYITIDDIKTWGVDRLITTYSINICINNNIINKLLVYKNKSYAKGALIKNIKKDNIIERKVYGEPVSPLLFNKDKNNTIYKSYTMVIPNIYKYLNNIYNNILGISINNMDIDMYNKKIIDIFKSYFQYKEYIYTNDIIISNINIQSIVISKTIYDIFHINIKINHMEEVDYNLFLIKEPYTDLTLLVLPPYDNYDIDNITRTIIEDYKNIIVIYDKSSTNYNVYKKYILDNGIIKSISTTHEINNKYDYNKDTSIDLFELDGIDFNIVDISYNNPYNADIKPINKLLERDCYVNITHRDIYDKSINDCITNLILKEKDKFINIYNNTFKNIPIEICNIYKMPYINKNNNYYGLYTFELKTNGEKFYGTAAAKYKGGERHEYFGYITDNNDLLDIDKIIDVIEYITGSDYGLIIKYNTKQPIYAFIQDKSNGALLIDGRIIKDTNIILHTIECLVNDNGPIETEPIHVYKLN